MNLSLCDHGDRFHSFGGERTKVDLVTAKRVKREEKEQLIKVEDRLHTIRAFKKKG